jgi:NAD(P)-dependent dehydrogenase (short-subunit alcohol dehydrogenase family)
MLRHMNSINALPPVTLLTGASRGLGLALARSLIDRGHRLLTLQRQPDAGLAAHATARGTTIEQWSVDLADPVPVAERLQAWVAALSPGTVGSLTLLNNAALLVEPGPLSGADLSSVSRATRASLEAPLLLTAAFLRASAHLEVPRRVLNISSGLGRFAMSGSATYCAAKAGMDHFSRAVALEEAERGERGARIVSLAPGVIDTDMQVQLRDADPAAFSSQGRFATMKASGQLDSPETAAAKVLAFLERTDFGANPIGDVRDPK